MNVSSRPSENNLPNDLRIDFGYSSDEDGGGSIEGIDDDDSFEGKVALSLINKRNTVITEKSKLFNITYRTFENATRTSKVQRNILLMERGIHALAVMCISLSLIGKEIEIQNLINKRVDNLDMIVKTCSLNMWVSILMVIINVIRSYNAFVLSKMRFKVKKTAMYLTPRKLARIIGQSLIMAICPYPFIAGKSFCTMNYYAHQRVCYYMNDLFHILQLAKLFYIVRSMMQSSRFASSRAYRVCHFQSTKNNSSFILKCLLHQNPERMISTMLILGILYFGYALRIAESPMITIDKRMDLTDYFNCCWTVLLTMSTVGYGDFYPRTVLGRYIMAICSIYGGIVNALLVAVAFRKLNLDPLQTKAYIVISRLEIRQRMKEVATKLVQNLGILVAMKKRRKVNVDDHKQLFEDVRQKHIDIANLKRSYQSYKVVGSEEDIENNFNIIHRDLKEIKKIVQDMRDQVSIKNTELTLLAHTTRKNIALNLSNTSN